MFSVIPVFLCLSYFLLQKNYTTTVEKITISPPILAYQNVFSPYYFISVWAFKNYKSAGLKKYES